MARLIAINGNPYLARERHHEVISALQTPDITLIDGQANDAVEQADEAGRSLPFLEPYVVVQIENALGQRSNGRGQSSARTAKAWTDAIPTLSGLPNTTIHIWTDGEVPKKSAALKLIAQLGQVHTLETPTGQRLKKWVAEEIGRRGGRATEIATKTLIEHCNGDLWRLAHECEKLALYTDAADATTDDVEELVDDASTDSVFAAIDAIFAGKPAVAADRFTRLIDQGQSEFSILNMLQREASVMATVAAMDEADEPDEAVLAQLQTKSDFVLRKTRDHVARVTPAGIHAWYDVALETDHAIKTGRMTPEQAILWATGALSMLMEN